MPIKERVARIIHVFAAVLLVTAVIVMTIQIVLRLVFNNPLSWPEEVVRYFFVWVVFLGSTVAVTRDGHIRVLVLIDRYGPRARLFSDWLDWAVNVFVFGFLAYWGADLAYKYKDAEFYTLGDWSQLWYYLALPIPAAISLVFLFLPGRRSGPSSPPSETRL